MVRILKIFAAVIFSINSLLAFAFAEERLTITTFYPSPYGSYKQLSVTDSGAVTATDYALYVTNTATSSTASINKFGMYISSTGTWNGSSANNYGLYIAAPTGGTNNYGLIVAGGNVGIGIANPSTALYVVGTITAQGATNTDTLGANASTDSHDLAEAVSSVNEHNLEPGDVVSIDLEVSQAVVKSRLPYDPILLGVISSKPAIQIGASDGNHYIALAGRVAVKVIDENGPILRGDYVTSSSRPGYAMKATKKGRVLGVSLGELKDKEGKVVIYVNPGWWDSGETEQLKQKIEELTLQLSKLEAKK